MTRSTLVLVGLLLGVPATLAAQTPMNLQDLVNRRGVYLDPQTLEAYSGPVVARSADGLVSERGTLRSGRWNGVHETFYLDGQLEVRETYADGVLDGPFESYFRSGRLSDKGTYEDGALEGPYEAYWSRLQGDLHAAHSNVAGNPNAQGEHAGMDMETVTGDVMEQGTWHDGQPCGEWYRFLPRNGQGLRTGETVEYPPCPAGSR